MRVDRQIRFEYATCGRIWKEKENGLKKFVYAWTGPKIGLLSTPVHVDKKHLMTGPKGNRQFCFTEERGLGGVPVNWRIVANRTGHYKQ